uniref:aminotransferase class III-fold pyridoxal phosphate-dependent enzyme n=1 Tax=Roseibium sp. TaxID=1936156 RepID=UPI003D115D0C
FWADEVITGFGRTGNVFGSTTMGIEAPDMMTFAKQISSAYFPISATVIKGEMYEALVEPSARVGMFGHGYTYSGHPACAAAALANLEIMEREGLVDRVKNDIGPYLKERWLKLGEHPLVGEARMEGLVGALELVGDKKNPHKPFADVGTVGTICRDNSFKHGMVMRAVRDSMIISPPLVLSHEEADFLVTTAEKTLDDTYQDLKRDGLLG